MDMKTFLNEVAAQRESRGLPSLETPDGLSAWQADGRRELIDEWGLRRRFDERHEPPVVTVTKRLEREGYSVECLWYEPSPGLVTTANLYRPTPDADRQGGPAILYLCGHHEAQKRHYQSHARRFVKLGYIVLITDTINGGEVRGYHRGTHTIGAFNWISKGYSSAAAEAWASLRGFDLLAGLPEVDPDRIGVTGHSGGGAVSWWVAALEPRVAAIVSSSGTGGENSHVGHRTVDGHCDCYFPFNPRGRSLAQTYALVAPRPTLVLAPLFDHIFEESSVRRTCDSLTTWHDAIPGASQWPLELFQARAGHTYTPETRQRAFAWMNRFLNPGSETDPDLVGDIDDHLERDEDLLVFTGEDTPPPNRNDSTADWLLPRDRVAWEGLEELAQVLRSHCFGFADLDAPLEARVERTHRLGEFELEPFTCVTESGWRIPGTLARPNGAAGPLHVVLVARDEELQGLDFEVPVWPPVEWLDGSPVAWLKVRGVGPNSWHPTMDWHIRRASMLLGRPLGAVRVFDALRGLEALRELSGAQEIILHGHREMAVTAAFTAALDESVVQLKVDQLPLSLDCRDRQSRVSATADLPAFDHQAEMSGVVGICDIPELLEALSERVEVHQGNALTWQLSVQAATPEESL